MASRAMVRRVPASQFIMLKVVLGFQSLDRVPWRAGIPRDWTSDLEKFEGLDPAEWCPRGYAIVNVDSRGVFDSDGDLFMLGEQVSVLQIDLLGLVILMSCPRKVEMVTMRLKSLPPCRGAMVPWHLRAIRILPQLNGTYWRSPGYSSFPQVY